MTKRADTILTMGATDTFKTSNVGRFARYIFEKYGGRTRLVSADLGGWRPIMPEVEAGLVEPISLIEAQNPLSAIRKLSRGEWPIDGKWSTDGLKNVAAYAVEGLTSISLLLLRDMAKKGRKVSQDVVGSFVEDGEQFSNPSMSHYGFVQSQALDMITAFSALPVHKILFSSHEGRGSDFLSKGTIYGPALVGQAATDKIPPMVGDLFHFETVFVKEEIAKGQFQERKEVRAYFTSHPDQHTGITWPSKVRLQPDQIASLRERWPDGYFVLTLEQGIDTYLAFQDELLQKSSSALREWMEQVEQGRKG